MLLMTLASCKEIEKEQQRQAQSTMADIHAQVAADSIAQYEMTKRNGDKIEICVHAGIVAAAFLQAKDEAGYTKWKGIEKADCKRAGM